MDRTLDSTLLHMVRTRLTNDYPGQIAACLEILTEAQIWWRPSEQANAAGNLALHLIGSNRYYLEHVIDGRELHRDRDAEFAARATRSRAELRADWSASVKASADVLDRLEPSQMTQVTERTGRSCTFSQILLHVTHHNAAHMGQIVWITKLLQPGSLNDLWMKISTR